MSKTKLYSNIRFPGRQAGIATLLTVILMLLMMTIMALYSTKVSMFEQTSSANDARQKQAFHAAEAGINIAIERMRASTSDLLSDDTNGWFAAASKHWLPCPSSPGNTHPCYAEKDATRRAGSFYYVRDATNANSYTVDIGAGYLPADESVTVGAVLCPLDVNYATTPPTVNGCTTTPESEMLITVIARGTSDNGRGQAVIKQVIADFDLAGGVPGVPLTVPSIGIFSGTGDIVANPNGGGEGVPLSVWSRGAVPTNGAVRTCEAYEFYDQFSMPADISCPGCDCAAGSELSSKFTRYSDIRDLDTQFPADLFEYFFGVPKNSYRSVKDSMANINGCDTLGSASNGAFWINGGCTLKAGCQVGTADKPVFLVVSGAFKMTGCDLYGMIFVTDAENVGSAPGVSMNGNATVYGAIMVDHDQERLNGTYAIVYNEEVLQRANTFNSLAVMPGGWSDYL